ncbi:hypothetical protein KCU62_g4582, partial [Aureobasidium sp. EXF-3399]
MCNTVTIRYSCNHSVQFHRSTCRSVIWVARPTTKPNKTTRKLPKRSVPESDNNGDPETQTRGRTLERSPSMLSLSSPPLSMSSPDRSLSSAPKIVSRPACKSSSEIMLRTQQKCGPCQRSTRRGFLQTMRARSELPSRKKRKHLKRGQPICGCSPLKHELTVEELLEPETVDQIRKRSVGFVGMVRNFTVRSRRKSL